MAEAVEHGRRFSDEQMRELHDDYHDSKKIMCAFIEESTKRAQRDDRRHDQLLEMLQQMAVGNGELTRNVTALAGKVETIDQNTRDIIQIHDNIKGTIATGKAAQSFMLWLLKWGAIGGAIATGVSWLLHFFGYKPAPPP